MNSKKFTALLLAAVMIVTLLAGCQKPMDAQTLVQKMTEAGKNTTEMAAKMTMELDLTMSMTGLTMDYGIDMMADIKYDADPVAMFMDMSITMEAMGMNETTSMQTYLAMENDEYVTYTYDGSMDTWTRSEQEEPADMTGVTETVDLTKLSQENMTLAEEKQTLGEREVYVLDCTITGELMQETLAALLESTGTELDEQTSALMGEMDLSAASIHATYYVDCESFLTLQTDMEIQGLGDVIGTMLGSEMMGMDTEELEMSFDVPTFKMSMTDMVYTGVEVPAVPQEGIDAAALNPQQGDGSYVLRLGEEAVRIVCPEGITGYYTEPAYLAAMSDDYMTSVDYCLTTDVAGANMADSVDAMVQEAKEYEMYDSHGDGEEVNGFTVMYLNYNDGTAYYFAWKDLDSCMLLVTAYVSESTVDMAPILNGIEDYEG